MTLRSAFIAFARQHLRPFLRWREGKHVRVTGRRVRAAYPEIPQCPALFRDENGRFVSGERARRAALHTRLRKELA